MDELWLVGVKQISQALDMSESSLRRLIRSDLSFPAFKLGNSLNEPWRVLPDDLKKWMKETRRKNVAKKRVSICQVRP